MGAILAVAAIISAASLTLAAACYAGDGIGARIANALRGRF